jgi:mono/diheme cytochrome c family protein
MRSTEGSDSRHKGPSGHDSQSGHGRHGGRLAAGAGVAASFAALALVLWLSAETRVTGSPTRASLAETFPSDIRHLVYAWDPTDARPEAERQRLLFDFIYETYQSSAWIPQALFDGNAIAQVVTGDVETIVRDRIGLVSWTENARVPAYGMAPSHDTDRALSWTVNCVICHTAEIDGVAYFGAGTKTFDEKALSDSLKVLTRYGRRAISDNDAAATLAAQAQAILTKHHHDKIDSLTRARSTAFAASHVELFMRPNGGRMPSDEEVGRGDVKVPPLWHVAAKQPIGRWYTDGSFHGTYPLMASSMELEKDRSFETLDTLVIPAIKQEFESVLQYLRPPPYPYAIDRALAEEGRALFYSREVGCSRCHGSYDGKGNVRWPGKHEDVGTDPSRLEVVRPQFIAAFNASPLAAEGALEASEGYAATPLTGVWANYPYLHNGSVPTLHHLLGPVSERPRIFEVMAARRFDRDRVGQQLHRSVATETLPELALLARFGANRDWFNVQRPGCGNQGHDFWPRIKTDARRRALIEYLKTL